MTLEEFLENGLEEYEYVQGALVQIPATSAEHGLVGSEVLFTALTKVVVGPPESRNSEALNLQAPLFLRAVQESRGDQI